MDANKTARRMHNATEGRIADRQKTAQGKNDLQALINDSLMEIYGAIDFAQDETVRRALNNIERNLNKIKESLSDSWNMGW